MGHKQGLELVVPELIILNIFSSKSCRFINRLKDIARNGGEGGGAPMHFWLLYFSTEKSNAIFQI